MATQLASAARHDVLPCSFSAWRSYIDRLHPEEIELGLARVATVARQLACSDFSGTVVTVAGTNGKGSAVAVLERLARAAGISVGAYTSPHLLRFNERLRLDGEELDDAAWCEAFETVERGRGSTPLTAFEFDSLAALCLLQDHAPRLLLLEAGLGGRLDAVAIVPPQLVLISSVALDHEGWLGDNREAIGKEKAALFTAGCQVVYGDLEPPQSVCQLASQLAVRWHGIGQQYEHESTPDGRWHWRGAAADSVGDDSCTQPLRGTASSSPLLDADSVAAALQAWFLLRPQLFADSVTEPAVAAAVATAAATRLAGRRHSLRRGGVRYLLDVAHNPAAAAHLAAALGAERPVAVLGMMADKDSGAFVDALCGVVREWCVAELPGERAAAPAALAAQLRRRAERTHCCDGVAAALMRAASLAGLGGTVLVTGSFVTVAEALRQLGTPPVLQS